MKRRRKQNLTLTASNGSAPSTPELPTFLDHIHELRKRLFWVVAVIVFAASVAYPYLDTIIKILTAPLGGQQLYYLTPVGGLSFSIQLCVYVGIMVAVPVIMYHLYRFLEPLMGTWRKSALFYVGLSSTLAVAGVLFAYFLSLPGALAFLTRLNLGHIQAMLTVDSYLKFVMTYLLGAALLFQIPLLLLIINTMTPLKPKKLMKAQRYVIVGAFIVAAIISPTPDLMNQLIFAIPIVAMYEIGVVMVWLQNKMRARKPRVAATPVVSQAQPEEPKIAVQPQPTPVVQLPAPAATAPRPRPAVRQVMQMDMVMRPPSNARLAPPPMAPMQKKATSARPQVNDVVAPAQKAQAPRAMAPKAQTRPVAPVRPAPPLKVPTRSVDGFMTYRSSFANSS